MVTDMLLHLFSSLYSNHPDNKTNETKLITGDELRKQSWVKFDVVRGLRGLRRTGNADKTKTTKFSENRITSP